MFVSRRPDGAIYGMWTVSQFEGQEFLQDTSPEVLAGPVNLPPQNPAEQRLLDDEADRRACKNDVQILPLVNMDKPSWITWAGANFLTLTAAERNRLGVLFWVVSIAVRRAIRNGG